MCARSRRLSRRLDDMPGLFDSFEFDPVGQTPDPAQQHKAELAARRREVLDRARQAGPGALEVVDDHASKLRFVSFGSGSSGNSAYIGTGTTGVLIDAGVEADTVVDGMKLSGLSMEAVAGIILTHDHSDHVRCAYTLLRRYKHMKLFATPKAMNGVLRRHNVSRRIKDYHQPIYKEFEFEIGPLTITAFETSHDGTDNMGFSITSNGFNFVVVTDTGYITERADFYIRKARALMIESNYDREMLRRCARPEYLKARIASARGHMDNADTAAYLSDNRPPDLEHVFLCHLSEDTNTPEIALDTVAEALRKSGATVGDGSDSLESRHADIQLMALPRFALSPLIIFQKS